MLPLVVLLSWPIVVALLFSRLDWPRAMIWSLLAGYLFLAPGYAIALPGLPILNKPTLPALMSAIMMFLLRDTGKAGEPPPPKGAFITAILVILVLCPLFTAATNGDPLIEGMTYRPGISASFAIADVMRAFFEILPFLLGYRLLWRADGARLLLQALVTGLLVYSIFMLIEVRLSPQMNVWIYGYFQHDFSQTMRYGGFRPIVFLQHPLWVASITLAALLSAIALARLEPGKRSILRAGYLAFILLICKSAGAMLLSFASAPLLLLTRPQTIIRIAMIAGTVAFTYPILRTTGLVPLQGIVDTALSVSEDRGRSLEFRLMNEETLLERAMERPLFGWGGCGRSLFYDSYTGNITAVPDGQWVIWLGSQGIVGYAGHFLLMLFPIMLLAKAAWKYRSDKRLSELLPAASLALILSMNMIDLIPNATITPITWLIAGTVMGNAQRLAHGITAATAPDDAAPDPDRPGLKTVL